MWCLILNPFEAYWKKGTLQKMHLYLLQNPCYRYFLLCPSKCLKLMPIYKWCVKFNAKCLLQRTNTSLYVPEEWFKWGYCHKRGHRWALPLIPSPATGTYLSTLQKQPFQIDPDDNSRYGKCLLLSILQRLKGVSL